MDANPPIRRLADGERYLIKDLADAGFGGDKKLAAYLLRAGKKVSPRSVGRIRKEPRPPAPRPPSTAPPSTRAVIARYAGHVFFMDITDIATQLRLFTFKLVVVLDLYSRMPLAFRLCPQQPTSALVGELLTEAVRRHEAWDERRLAALHMLQAQLHRTVVAPADDPAPGPTKPARHLVTDKGTQLTSAEFQHVVDVLHLDHRFGAIGKYGSIAVIERFWRTLKGKLGSPHTAGLSKLDLARKVELTLFHYAFVSPHQSLHGRTPAEAYYGFEMAPLLMVPPSRGRPGDDAGDPGLRIAFLDDELRLPVLLPKAA